MQIEAIYDHGRLDLPKHIRLRHHRFKVQLDIPEAEIFTEQGDNEEVESSTGRETLKGGFLEEMHTILAPVRKHLAAAKIQSLSKEERRELFCQEWELRNRDGRR